MSEQPYKSWRCRTCGFIYEEESGAPEEGLAPGTTWAEIPDDWVCPLCSTAKSDFDMVELLDSKPRKHSPPAFAYTSARPAFTSASSSSP